MSQSTHLYIFRKYYCHTHVFAEEALLLGRVPAQLLRGVARDLHGLEGGRARSQSHLR